MRVSPLYVSLPISSPAIVCAVARDLCSQPCRSFQLANRGLLCVCGVGRFAQSVSGSTQPCMHVSLSAGFFCAAAANRIYSPLLMWEGTSLTVQPSGFWSLQIVDPTPRRTACQHNGVEVPQPPRDVLRLGERMQFRSAEKLFLVHFFDSKRSW